jgi:iron complex outermembrane recepter protein
MSDHQRMLPRTKHFRRRLSGLHLTLCCCASPLLALTATAATPTLADFKRMSLEELMEIEVFSASRRLEPTQSVPSAVFVLTSEDLRRSRVTSIPEALRLVPGVQVGRVDANKWAVSMRGFNSREANKLLVLLDGRSIYDPLFSGVLWESQDVMLEDVDRIEVIRGPGGTVWGANAFNGVINIISKPASATQGGLTSVSAGDQETYSGAFRFGWQPTQLQAARIYVKTYEREEGHSRLVEPNDDASMFRTGFRWDRGTSQDDMRLSGDLYDATAGDRQDPMLVQDVGHQGHNLTGQWSRKLSASNTVQARFTYDFVALDGLFFDQDRRTYDLELQQTVSAFADHLIVWGAGYRRMRDATESGLATFVDVLPKRRDDTVLNGFVQDTVTLVPDTLNLVLGIKYERTDYADGEWLPNVRLSWTPRNQQTLWAAVSEATRVPSRLESDLTFFGTIRTGDNFAAEQVRAYELGQRWLLAKEFWLDLALFYNDYEDLRTSEAGGQLLNGMQGTTYGAELAARWEPVDRWRIDLAYTYLRSSLKLERTSTAGLGQVSLIEGLSPRQQISVRIAFNPLATVELDAALRYVDDLPSIADPVVPLEVEQYTVLDLAVSWRPIASLELALVGQNLLQDHHLEQDFALSASGLPTEVERQVYGKATWNF